MKILHLSHNGLPDWRIEKASMSGRKYGYDTYFAGGAIADYHYNSHSFSGTFEIDWSVGEKTIRNPGAILGISYYWNKVRSQVKKVIEDIRPDIIHAHNIYAAKIASQLGVPYVYDDHEYWSRHALLTQYDRKGPIFKKAIISLQLRRIQQLCSNWEKDIVSSVPVITVSKEIANDFASNYQKKGRMYVVPNFPTLDETKNLIEPRQFSNLRCIYVGVENRRKVLPHRDIEGLVDAFENWGLAELVMVGPEGTTTEKVRYTGVLNREKMYSEMATASIGLLPWKKHWFHRYSNPNKAYEYAHSGLFVMCTSSLTTIRETLEGNCYTFDNYDSMISQLQKLGADPDDLYAKRCKIFKFARSKLLWDNNEQQILSAYREC